MQGRVHTKSHIEMRTNMGSVALIQTVELFPQQCSHFFAPLMPRGEVLLRVGLSEEDARTSFRLCLSKKLRLRGSQIFAPELHGKRPSARGRSKQALFLCYAAAHYGHGMPRQFRTVLQED